MSTKLVGRGSNFLLMTLLILNREKSRGSENGQNLVDVIYAWSLYLFKGPTIQYTRTKGERWFLKCALSKQPYCITKTACALHGRSLMQQMSKNSSGQSEDAFRIRDKGIKSIDILKRSLYKTLPKQTHKIQYCLLIF